MFASRSIRDKLIIINSAIALFVLIVAAIVLVINDQWQRKSFLDQRISQQAQVVARNATAAVMFEDWESSEEILDSLAADSAVVDAYIVDASGEIRSSLRRDVNEQIKTDNPDFIISREIFDQDVPIGSVIIHASENEVADALWPAVGAIAALTLVELLVVISLSSWMQGIIANPIGHLSDLVRRIRKSSEYNLRATPVYNDEVGQLTDDINAMLEMIEQRDIYLAKEVADRTASLAERNEQLQIEIRTRKDAHRALRATQEDFRNAFENAPIGMALVDQSGLIDRKNAVFDQMLGTDGMERCDFFEFIEEDYQKLVRTQFGRLVSGEIDRLSAEIDCTGTHQRTITTAFGASPVKDERGNFLYSVVQLQDITESRELSLKLAYQANHDALTGLANRRAFEVALNELKSVGPRDFTLCLLDLDQFKVVNDTCGHAAGDELLVEIADILRRTVRQEDLVVRLGGDEFAVVLYDCNSERGGEIAENIRAEIEDLIFSRDGRTFRVGASIGVVPANTDQDISEVLQKADSACFSAKDAGRNQIHLVVDNDEEIAQKHGEMQWVHRLHRAMQHDDFIIYTQPILPINQPPESERLEVLIRLRDRAHNRIIPPGAFMPAAERYGLSIQLDQWVVRNLIRTLSVYRNLFDDDRRFWLNLSGHSIGNEEFLGFLERAIAESDFPSGTLNFEITETAVIHNITTAARVMRNLKSYGCQFALDDFGAGQSSFGYLKKLPVDYIKIDGLFVRDIATDKVDQIFVKSIIDIARVMGIRSIAEFVETQETLDIVRDLGIDYGQGFALGRPSQLLPADTNLDSEKVG